MSGNYNLYLTTPTGTRIGSSRSEPLATLNTVIEMAASRVVNRVGTLYVKLPVSFDVDLLKRDRMIQVHRAPRGGRMSLWRPYFIRRWRFSRTNQGDVVEVWGYCPNHLLTRRIVAYYAGQDGYSEYTSEYADDIMKDLVTDAMSDPSGTYGPDIASGAGTRAWGDLSVQGDLSDGPALSVNVAWQRLLTMAGGGALAKVEAAAREEGTEVFFDVAVANYSELAISYEFRTYTGQPGSDLSSGNNRVLFSMPAGSLEAPSLEYDYSQEINYAYSGGRDIETNRNIQQVYDSDRYGASPWNRCEGFADARNQDTDNGVREEGRQLVDDHRGRVRFTADLMDTTATRFGRDWNWGDQVAVKYRNLEIDAIVRSVVLRLHDGNETVQARVNEA